MLDATKALDVHIDRVVGKCAKRDIGAKPGKQQMGRIEFVRGARLIVDIIGHTGTAHDKRANTQVEWGVTGGILRCQRVENELEVVRCVGVLPIDGQTSTKELGR